MPFLNNGQIRYHVAIAADEGQSKLARALAYWQDLIELHVIQDHTPGTVELPAKVVENLSRTWAALSTDYQHGDVTIEELRGFVQAFTSAAGLNAELSGWAQEAFEWIGGEA
ncbi:hypothetical protein [Pseudomonas sp. BN102]|uniref:hypothetical protein n=1 Tax=Pseudomonas sp. BN102 TaxID=2567886 RepID=UPI002458CCA9|nr:hypothetical protein [Pseudomonas sp. BN102]MDH4610310.1 hypothetical protein [Pseudomonas sp. BN102]